jgi:MOSC domain-containing protein
MPNPASTLVGEVKELWRYPVKSMMGEQLPATEVTESGLLGDRAYALRDTSDGKIATAKNPRKWPNLFDYGAALTGAATAGEKLPPARITLSDGTTISTEEPDAARILSAALKREVRLEDIERNRRGAAGSSKETSEEYWLDMEGLEHRDTVTDFNLPEGTFFDTATIHILTTATLQRLHELYPEAHFAVPRFRPNVVVSPTDGSSGFVENAWLGRVVAIGESVRLRIDLNCARCVMTTLAHGDLPKDPGILRTAAQHNQVNVGVYASVLQGGKIKRGDSIRLE